MFVFYVGNVRKESASRVTRVDLPALSLCKASPLESDPVRKSNMQNKLKLCRGHYIREGSRSFDVVNCSFAGFCAVIGCVRQWR